MKKDNYVFYIDIKMGVKIKEKGSEQYIHFPSSGLAYISRADMTKEEFDIAKEKIEKFIEATFKHNA